MKSTSIPIITIILLLTVSCNNFNQKNYIHDFPPFSNDGNITVVVEIPSGTMEKWEVDKTDGELKLEMIDGKPRIINYLGYPGNYGFIPQTLLDKQSGGDGDPLDVIVIGPPEERGSVISCKLLGVLYLKDTGETDDKLIALSKQSTLFKINSLEELQLKYPGILEILKTWFKNYKGPGKMTSTGFGNKKDANRILELAIEGYNNKN